MRTSLATVLYLSLSSVLAACGGGTPEPATAESAESAAEPKGAESAEAPSAKQEGESAAAASGSEPAEEKPAKEAPPARSAKDVLTRPDVLFMMSFSASEPYQKAEKACEEKSKGDPKKKAECLAKARAGMDADGIAFQKDADGTYYWLTITRKGNGLVTLHKIAIEFGEDGEKQITILPKGPDKGTKRMANIPKELVIEVPGDSEIAIQDPKQGRLVYEAKLGLLGEQQR